MPTIQEITCASCGNAHQQHYCPNCGEKRFDPRALSIKHFFAETLEGFFHFDNKFLRSLQTLLLRPGQLSVDHVEGRRVGSVRPLPLFLIINLIAFVVLFNNPFSLPLKSYITYRPFVEFNTAALVNAKVTALGTTLSEFEKRFDEAMHGSSKAWLVLFIPVYALFFGVLFIPKRRRVTEHLVFATHYVSFVLIAFPLILFLVGLPLELLTHRNGPATSSESWDNTVVAVFTLSFIVYLFIAVRRFYKVHVIYALVAAVIVGAGFFEVLQFYRMFLFHWVMHGLK